MKKKLLAFLTSTIILTLAGCSEPIDDDEVLMTGIDLKETDLLITPSGKTYEWGTSVYINKETKCLYAIDDHKPIPIAEQQYIYMTKMAVNV